MKVGYVSLAAIAAALAVPVHAQDAVPEEPRAERGGGLNEIVVTAQKRVENVQDVPIAISAFGEEALQERAIGDVSALSAITPNVTLDASTPFSGSSAVLGATIRGIGSSDFAFNIDPAVGVYLDGVYLGRSIGANQDLLDVERIEVLKGPQGTLFGRNTLGGAISIVTRTPGDVFRVQGDLTTGSFERFQARTGAGQYDHLAVELVAADQIEFAEGALQQHLELGFEFTARQGRITVEQARGMGGQGV